MTRRSGVGESSIYEDDEGRWHGWVSMGRKPDGTRDRRHVSCVDPRLSRAQRRAEVVRKVRELEKRRDEGTVGAAGRAPTVAVWLDHWLDTIAARKVRQSTLDGYRSKVQHRIRPALGHHRLDRLAPEHVEAAYAAWEAEGLASATVLQCHRILSRSLKVAVQRGKVARNVCVLVDAPSLVRDEVQPLSAGDARALLAAAAGERNAARWSVALALGLRQGEALGIPWDAVDLDAGTLTVRQALARRKWQHGCGDDRCGRKRGADCPRRHGGGLVLDRPKSRAAHRSIRVPDELVSALRAQRAEQLAERLAAGSVWEEHGLVFAQPTGRPIDPSDDWAAWKALLRKAGVRDARLHDARHTAATLLLQQGVPARVAMGILGHSQISLTLGTYSHVVPELADDAAARMGQALWGTAETEVATRAAPSRGGRGRR